jgi:RNA polymerase sigma factor (TIGR02999 family)
MTSDRLDLLFETPCLGNRADTEAFYRSSFVRLRSIASALLASERPGHTLQPTALVNELFLKMNGIKIPITGEEHLFRLAARAMKQVLIDYGRGRGALRRAAPDDLRELMRETDGVEVELRLAAKSVFGRLEKHDPTAAASIWLRYVEGFSLQEIAERQHRELWRVKVDCEFGARWMAHQLGPFRKAASTSRAQRSASGGRSRGWGA